MSFESSERDELPALGRGTQANTITEIFRLDVLAPDPCLLNSIVLYWLSVTIGCTLKEDQSLILLLNLFFHHLIAHLSPNA